MSDYAEQKFFQAVFSLVSTSSWQERMEAAAMAIVSLQPRDFPDEATCELRSMRSEIVRQIFDSAVVQSKADDRENVGPTGNVEQRRPFLPSSVFASGVNAITSVSTTSMELVSLVLRCTERSLGAIQTLMRCRTPGEFLVAYSDLVRANLNDAFEGAEKVLRQTRR